MLKLTPSYTSFNAIHRSLEFTLTRGKAIVITHFHEVSELRFVSHLHAEDNWIIKNPLFLRMSSIDSNHAGRSMMRSKNFTQMK